MADHDIKLATELETKDVKKSAQELQREISKVFEAASGKKADENFKRIESRMSKNVVKSKELIQNMERLEKTQIPTEEYQEMAKYVEKTNAAVISLEEKNYRLEQSGKKNTQQYQENVKIIEQMRNEIVRVEDDMRKLEDEGKAFTSAVNSVEYSKQQNELANINNEMRILLGQASNYSVVIDESGEHIQKTEDKLRSMVESFRDSAEEARMNITTVDELEKSLSETERQVRNIGLDIEAIDLSKDKEDVDTIQQASDEVRQHIGTTSKTLEDIIDSLNRMVSSGQITDEQAAEYLARIEEADRALRDAAQDSARLGEYTGQSKEKMVGLVDSLKMMPKALGKGFVDLLKSVPKIIGTIASAAKTAAIAVANLGKKLLQVAGNGIKRGLSSLVSHISGIGSSAGKSDFSMKKLFWNLMKYGVGIRSLYAAFRKLRSAITEGIKNMAQWHGGMNSANNSISMLMSSLTYLKNSWAAAFAPIINFVAPAISRLIDLIAALSNRMASMVAAFTGAQSYMRAKKTSQNYAESLNSGGGGKSAQEKYEAAQKKAQEKYEKDLAKVEEKRAKAVAKAEEKQAKAAAKLAKEQEKANKQLGDYDELNIIAAESVEELSDAYDAEEFEDPVMQEVNWEDFADGAGAGFDDMFEEVPVDGIMSEWMQKLMDAVKSQNWDQLGRIIADGLNTGMNIVDDWINNVLRPKGVEIASALAEFGNGFVDNFNWPNLGKMIGDGLNAIADIINTFLTEFNFEDLGKGIGSSIKAWFDTVDWDLLGQTFANKWNALIDTIFGIVTTPGIWESMGSSIVQFVESWFGTINWEKLISTFTTGFNGFISVIKQVLTSIDFGEAGKEFGDRVVQLFQEIDWAQLAQTISLLFTDLFDFLTSIDWGQLAIELGTALGELLANVDWMKLIKQLNLLFAELVGAAILGVFQLGGTLLSELAEAIGKFFEQLGLDGVAGFFYGMSEKLSNIGNWIKENMIDPLIEAVKNFLGIHSPSTVFMDIGINLIEGFKEGISSAWEALKTFVSTSLENMKLSFLTVWNSVKEKTLEVWDKIKSGVIEKFTALKNNVVTLVNNVRQVFTNMKTSVVSTFQGMWNTVKGVINSMLSGIEKMANGIIKGFNGMINAVNKCEFDVPDWVPLIGGESLGFHLPTLSTISIPRLAQGAVIPPNSQFLAVLGDQKQGTNIETPLETMVEAFKMALAEQGGSNNQPIVLQLNGRTIAQAVWDEENKRYKQRGSGFEPLYS